MKNILRYTGLWMIAFLLFSCAKEEIDLEGKCVVEGIPTQVILNYDVPHNTVISRAEQESQYEYRVSNLYVFIFKSDGSVYFQDFFEEGSGLTVNNGTSSSNGTVSFDTRTIADVKIVGIANLTTNTVATAYTVTPDQMNAIKTLDELEAFVMKMNSNTVYRGGMFMLTGTAVDELGNESIDITGSESGTSTIDCSIKLKRTDAKVKFNVTTEPSNHAWQNFSFQPREWSVKKVPSQSYVLPKTGTVDADGEYFETPLINFEEVTRSEAGLYNGGSFVFYMPENKKAPRTAITEPAGDYNAQYALRDESDKNSVSGTGKPGQEYENGAFTYANENSTYVEMTGTLTYIDALGKNVNADVKYIVHLGAVDGVNDYNTERNVYYIYNVKVKGINDIIVEVTNATGDDELRPGHEGDVVYSNASVYELDSHYDRILININKSQIDDDMTWGIRTPFSSGIYQNDNNFVGLEDYKWVKFAINKDYGIAADRYVKYPGDQNYNNPNKKGAGNDEPSPSYPTYENARLLDIQQLIERLKTEKDNSSSQIFDRNGDVAITVFVDENLYFDNPVTGQPGAENRSLWKVSVDKEDRMLHIIAGGSKYSPDGNSSIVNSLVTFKQKAIRTIFNTDKASLTTAWGLESVMETKRLVPGDVSQGTDRRNGRVNMIKWAVGKNWTSVLSVQDRYALGNGYESAAYACMLRNRDLNGDNVIDQNEVRWYLAAVDQLVDIYLGEYALDEASRLYPLNEVDRGGNNGDEVADGVRWHYTSSSHDGTNPWVLWAEEGAGLGSYGNSTNLMGGRYAYRCVRNLGLSLDNPDENPSDLVSVVPQSDGTYMVDMSNMSVKSRRTNYEIVQLPEHNERDADNRPYEKFQVLGTESDAPTPRTSAYYWDWQWNVSWDNGNAWQYYQTENVCPPGYRIPNQRELLIMSSRLPEDAWKTYVGRGPAGTERARSKAIYICQTAFSMDGINGYSTDRDGFHYNAESKAFVLQNNQSEVGYVRCVRDIQQ